MPAGYTPQQQQQISARTSADSNCLPVSWLFYFLKNNYLHIIQDTRSSEQKRKFPFAVAEKGENHLRHDRLGKNHQPMEIWKSILLFPIV
jgi:hypothetical protein